MRSTHRVAIHDNLHYHEFFIQFEQALKSLIVDRANGGGVMNITVGLEACILGRLAGCDEGVWGQS